MPKGDFKKFLDISQSEKVSQDPLANLSIAFKKVERKLRILDESIDKSVEPITLPSKKVEKPQPKAPVITEIAVQAKAVPVEQKDGSIKIQHPPKKKPDLSKEYIKTLEATSPSTPQIELLIDENVRTYISEQMRDMKIFMEKSMHRTGSSAGGTGSVAVQFAEGGTMRGNLTVTGLVSAAAYAGIDSRYVNVSGDTIEVLNATDVPLTLIGASGQTADLFKVQAVSGTDNLTVNSNGKTLIGSGATVLGSAALTVLGSLPCALKTSSTDLVYFYNSSNVLVGDYSADGSGNGLLRIRNTAGTTAIQLASNVGTTSYTNGKFVIGGSTALGTGTIYGHNAAEEVLVLKETASQTASAFAIQTSGSTSNYFAVGPFVNGGNILVLGDGSTAIGSGGRYISFLSVWGTYSIGYWGAALQMNAPAGGETRFNHDIQVKDRIGFSTSANGLSQAEFYKVADQHVALHGADAGTPCSFTISGTTSLGTLTVYGSAGTTGLYVQNATSVQSVGYFTGNAASAPLTLSVIHTGNVGSAGGGAIVIGTDDGAFQASGDKLGSIYISSRRSSGVVNSAGVESYAAETFSSSSYGTNLVMFRGKTGSAATWANWFNADGTNVFNGSSGLGTLTVYGHLASAKTTVIQAAASQSVNIFEIQNSSATAHLAVLSDGKFRVGSLTPSGGWQHAITTTSDSNLEILSNSAYGCRLAITNSSNTWHFYSPHTSGWYSGFTEGDLVISDSIAATPSLLFSKAANQLVVNGTSKLGTFSIHGHLASSPVLGIKSIASQSADIFQLQNSADTILARFNSAGTLGLSAGIQLNTSLVSTDYSLLSTDTVVVATTGTFTVQLPSATGLNGHSYIIKNMGAGTVTVSGEYAETLDGSNTISLSQYDGITIMSLDSEWAVIEA